jgi:signal transduction histidine kinase/phage shock protein PspC (stress-responsive transcriptional regulator)
MADLSELRSLLNEVRTAERPDERMVAGVCEGLGRHLGVDPMVLRLAFVVLGLANGVGIVLYALLWSLLPSEGDGPVPTVVRPPVRPTADRAFGVGLITLGGTLLIATFGLVVPPGLVWSVAMSAVGFSLVWARTSDEGRARWMGRTRGRTSAPIDSVPRGRVLVLRAIAGGVLLVIGLAVLFASGGLLSFVGQLGLAVVATGVGVALLLGPWMVRLWRERESERRQRIRSEERSEMAAHLHDSVLQTLTMIQRHADDSPGRARMLARRQERELRAWLFDDRAPADGRPDHLLAALEAMVTEVEARHEVEVDLVVVGDSELDRRLEGLVAAVREATNNAARHAGVAEVAVYVEVEPERVTAYVRDRGRGFDPAAVEPGRLGVSESIIGRMARHGGRAEVHSTLGEGTEVVVEVGRPSAEARR